MLRKWTIISMELTTLIPLIIQVHKDGKIKKYEREMEGRHYVFLINEETYVYNKSRPRWITTAIRRFSLETSAHMASLEQMIYTVQTKRRKDRDTSSGAPNCIHKLHRHRIPQISKLFHALMPYSCASHILRVSHGVNCESPITLIVSAMTLVIHVPCCIMYDAFTCDYAV